MFCCHISIGFSPGNVMGLFLITPKTENGKSFSPILQLLPPSEYGYVWMWCLVKMQPFCDHEGKTTQMLTQSSTIF